MEKNIHPIPIQTYYDGHWFRSRLEARWAVVFKTLGVPYEYEPEGFNLGNGLYYLPDFRVKCYGRRGTCDNEPFDLYIEVKGKATDEDARKIKAFVGFCDNGGDLLEYPLLIVDKIPDEGCATCCGSYDSIGFDLYAFNYETVDGDHFGAYPAATRDGRFFLMGDDSNYCTKEGCARMEYAYRAARCARFEHGEHPPV